MKRKFKYNRYRLPPWLRSFRNVCGQFIVPLCVFQGLRTIIFPTIIDVLLLLVMILLAIAFQMDVV